MTKLFKTVKRTYSAVKKVVPSYIIGQPTSQKLAKSTEFSIATGRCIQPPPPEGRSLNNVEKIINSVCSDPWWLAYVHFNFLFCDPIMVHMYSAVTSGFDWFRPPLISAWLRNITASENNFNRFHQHLELKCCHKFYLCTDISVDIANNENNKSSAPPILVTIIKHNYYRASSFPDECCDIPQLNFVVLVCFTI